LRRVKPGRQPRLETGCGLEAHEPPLRRSTRDGSDEMIALARENCKTSRTYSRRACPPKTNR
jgi:hypothetical protein